MTRYVRKGRSVTAVMRDDGTVYFDVESTKPVGELVLECLTGVLWFCAIAVVVATIFS